MRRPYHDRKTKADYVWLKYREYLAGWHALGGGLLCAFDSTSPYSKWGNWGHAEDYGPGSERSPKYRALVEFIAMLPTQPAGR